MTGVLIVAHGDPADPASSRSAHAAAEIVRASNRFSQVEVAALKESPAPAAVLEAMTARPLWVVPFFMADGWFVRTVVPRAFSLSRTRYRILPAVGLSPGIVEAVLERASHVGCSPSLSALVVVGHGTPRAPRSRDSALRVVEAIERMGVWSEVVAVFTDDEPSLGAVAQLTSAENIVAVPFFAGEGFHPSALLAQLSVGEDRAVHLARSAGSSPALGQIVIDIVTAAQDAQS